VSPYGMNAACPVLGPRRDV